MEIKMAGRSAVGAARGGMSARDQAAARSRMAFHLQGSGPTILSAVSCSSRTVDAEFVAAAARGDLTEVLRLLPQVSHVDVRTRLRGKARPMSALHMAAAFGSLDVVNVLLDSGADHGSRMEWLRALTPLHMATSVSVAERLLAAGAQPIALDPREPDPAWYQRQQGRNDVADAIITARINARLVSSAHAHAPSAAPVPNPSPALGAKRSVIPSLTAADIVLIRECWGCSAAALEAVVKASTAAAEAADRPSRPSAVLAEGSTGEPEEVEEAPATAWRLPLRSSGGAGTNAAVRREEHGSTAAEELPNGRECAVCMGELDARTGAGVPLTLLPCGMSSATPHAFHADCLERWLLVRATCPTCRSDVRPLLRHHMQQQQQQQLPPPQPPPQPPSQLPQTAGESSTAGGSSAAGTLLPVSRARAANAPAAPQPQRSSGVSPRGGGLGRGRPHLQLKKLIAPAPLDQQQLQDHAAAAGRVEGARPSALLGSPRTDTTANYSASCSASPRRCHTVWGGNGNDASPMLPQVQALASLGRHPSLRSSPRAMIGSDVGWVPTGSLWAAIR